MRKNLRRLMLLSGSVALASVLTACPVVRPYDPGVRVNFVLPASAASERLAIKALYTTRDDEGKITLRALDGASGYVNGTSGSVTLPRTGLDKVVADSKCLPYRADKVTRSTEPSGARSCDINFFVYDVANGPSAPSAANLRYLTHDTYSYASEKLSYTSSLSGGDVTSQETGTRRQGWSLVRHLVLSPAATPNVYRVVRDSVDDSRLNLPLTMHAPSDYFTSMSVTGAKR